MQPPSLDLCSQNKSISSFLLPLVWAATERMLVYDIDMVPDWKNSSNPAANVTKLTRLQDGVVNSGVDGGQPVINFGATYHITKIVYAGRPETGSSVNLRMRNAKFYSSMDGVTYTLFHTVPADFAQDASSLTTNDLSSANVVGRYFKWTGIGRAAPPAAGSPGPSSSAARSSGLGPALPAPLSDFLLCSVGPEPPASRRSGGEAFAGFEAQARAEEPAGRHPAFVLLLRGTWCPVLTLVPHREN